MRTSVVREKILAIFLSNGRLFRACVSRYKHERVMGELEAVMKTENSRRS